jgi:membrane protein DedA with SNARE-associated domain
MRRQVLLVLAVVRGVLAVVAIPLAPALYRHHPAVLVLLRPSKEVLLFAGYMIRDGKLSLWVAVVAALPLLVFAAWVFFGLGREYREDLQAADLPGIAGRVLPRERIQKLCEAINDRGWPLVLVGRIAIMPSTLVAAAAGAAEVELRTFALADAAGSAISLAMTIGAGFLLGEARESAGPWLTVVGAIAFLGLATVLGRSITGGGRRRAAPATAS